MIFVTGGTGLLGNWIIRELVARGEAVRALCRPGTEREPFEGLAIEVVEGDLSDATQLKDFVSGCHAVVHSAAYIHIGWQNLEKSREINVEGTRRLAAACLEHAVRLIHVSTVDTLPAARSSAEPVDEHGRQGIEKTRCAYVVSKSEAEKLVDELVATANLDAVVVHPGFMLAPNDWKPSSGRMMLEVSKAPIAMAPAGGCSVCDARDVAAAIVNACQRGQRGRHYILAGENLTYETLFNEMLRTCGQRRRSRPLGLLAPIVAKIVDSGNRLLHLREGDINGAAIALGSLKHYYTSLRAEQEMDYRRRPLNETLQETWKWLASRT